MNKNVNFNSFQFQKIWLRFTKSDFCGHFWVSLPTHSLFLWPDGTLIFSSKPWKISLLEAKIFKIIQNVFNMDPSSDCFLCACQIWTWYDHWESLKIGLTPLYWVILYRYILYIIYYLGFFGFFFCHDDDDKVGGKFCLWLKWGHN